MPRLSLARIAIGSACAITLVTVGPYFAAAQATNVDDLQGKITDRKKDIDRINERLKAYQEQIAKARQEASSLKGQIGLVEQEIGKQELEIELTKTKIQQTILEIQSITAQITQREQAITQGKQHLTRYLQLLYQQDQTSLLEILATYDHFSDFFDSYESLQQIQRALRQEVADIQSLKAALELQRSSLQAKKADEEQLKIQLEEQRRDLEQRQTEQVDLLQQTERSERKFQLYVQQLQQEQRQIEREITGLERKIREELERRAKAKELSRLGKIGFQWPTDGRYITARFHDPDYPYRYIFEHPAIDIRAPQGSAVFAAEEGIVGKVKNGGAKGYSYVMVVHRDGFSTVYGHVSRSLVKEGELVQRGQTIAASGGKPGTPGAGALTSGPHLHFEIRLNSVPTDPLKYLPRDW